jgi:hypothetical protein
MAEVANGFLFGLGLFGAAIIALFVLAGLSWVLSESYWWRQSVRDRLKRIVSDKEGEQ